MATPGRKPKPSYLKAVEGNRGHRPENRTEVQVPPTKKTRPPTWLGKHGKREWKRLFPILNSRGLLTDMDLGTYAALCEAFDDWMSAATDVAGMARREYSTPNGAIATHPAVHRRDRARDAYVKIGALFGLSPSERGRLNLPGPDGAEEDPMEAALKQRSG